jgi:hypothetical protein
MRGMRLAAIALWLCTAVVLANDSRDDGIVIAYRYKRTRE